MIDGRITRDDGRTIAYREIGDPEGVPIMHFHGAPSARNAIDYLHDEFREQGVRVISPDRPGYGCSTPMPNRTLEDWPEDVAALADALDIDRFAVIGLSSGGPYTIATCATLPERVIGGVVVCGVTDPSIDGVVNDLPKIEQEVMSQPDETTAIDWCIEHFGRDGDRFYEHEPFEWAEPDVAYLEQDSLDGYLEAVTEESFRQGIVGFAQDMHIQGKPWPIDPSHIQQPILVIHGEQDRILPVSHSRHTANLLPNATLRVLETHGHASLTDEFPQFVSDIIDMAA